MRKKFTPPAVAINLVNFIYKRIFHEEMSGEVKSFLRDLTYVGLGVAIATPLSFAFNILAGRMLGPTEYGKFTLVQSVANFLYIPMVLGFTTAMVKYTAEKEDAERRRSIISTTYTLVFAFIIITVGLYFIFPSQLSRVLSIPPGLFYLSVIFAVLHVLNVLTEGTLRGLGKMKAVGIFKPVYAAILLGGFLLFILNYQLSFKAAVYSNFLAYGIIAGAILIFFLRKYLRFEFDKSWVRILATYGVFALISGITYTFYANIDKILINRYMTVADVGIYRAYNYASTSAIMLPYGIFMTVYFPTVSKYENKGTIFSRINKLIPYLIGLGVPFAFLCEFVILKLYGGEYPINFALMLIFALVPILLIWYGLYDWLFCSQGVLGVKLVTISTATVAAINILLNIYLIPRFGLYGAIGATVVAYAVGICCLSLLRRKIM